MKKVLFILSFIPNLLFAQNMDNDRIKNDWEKLVSYIGSQYFKSIVEEYLPNASQEERDAYDTNIKKYIDESTLATPTSLSSIKDFSKWESSKEKWEKYNKKMKLPDNERNFDKLFSGDDEKHIRNVKEEIKKEYAVQESQHTNTQYPKVEQNIEELRTMETKLEEKMSSIKTFVIPSLIALLALLVGISFWFYRQITAIKNNLETQKQNNKKNNIQSVSENEIDILNSKIRDLSKEVENLRSQLSEAQNIKPQTVQQDQLQSVVQQPQSEPEKVDVKLQQDPQIKESKIFLEYFDNGEFKEGSEAKCFYRMEKNSGKFFFIESKLKEALANNGFSLDICDSCGSKNGATRVKLNSPGKVEQQANGRWKVVEKINLKFE